MENENTTNTTTAAGPSKFCAACGAQLHIQAEICPKCGVRQAPPPHAAQGPGANPAQQGGAFFSEMTQEIRSMGFLAWLKKMTSSNGRASRKEFIAVAVICNVLILIIAVIAELLGIPAIIILSNIVVFLLAAIILLCMPRRLHDMNLPGWITVILFFIMLIFNLNYMGTQNIAFLLPYAVIMIALAVIPGTAGRNKYGEPPK